MTDTEWHELDVVFDDDLHMRPLQELAATASKFNCQVVVDHGGDTYNAKSLLDLLFIAHDVNKKNPRLMNFKACGSDAKNALNALNALRSAAKDFA